MPPRIARRLAVAGIMATILVAASACQTRPEPAVAPKPAAPESAKASPPPPPRNEIPSGALREVMKAHLAGLGNMEQYEYARAVEQFRKVHERAPGWIPGSINLAIALLNDTGVKVEKAKNARGGAPAANNFDEALQLLADVLEREPDNPYAHFCRGIILEQQGSLAEAHRHFRRVTEIDPKDASAWYWTGSTVTDPQDPLRPPGPAQAKEQIELFAKALALNPYLTPAIYKLAFAYRYAGQAARQKELLDQWRKMDPERLAAVPGPGDLAGKRYGEMGRYASVIDPFGREESGPAGAAPPPKFDAAGALSVALGEGEHWVRPADFAGKDAVVGRVRARFGASVSAFDVDGDGRLDLYLASAVAGKRGIRDVLLRSRGDGRFEDASSAFGLPEDRGSIGVAAGDFDADRHIDLFLTGVGGNRLLRNMDGKRFEDISAQLKPMGPPALSLTARWIDLDQDGDLDLYVVNYCAAEHAGKAFGGSGGAPPGIANVAYRNDGQPDPSSAATPEARAPAATAYDAGRVRSGLSIAMTPWTESPSLLGGDRPHVGIALLDLEDDRDMDLVLSSDGDAPVAILNDRLGRFREVAIKGPSAIPAGSGLLTTDLDADGRADLVAPSAAGPVLAWRNVTERSTAEATTIAFAEWPINASRWRMAQAIDLDLDGRPDLLGLPAASDKPGDLALPSWARNEGKRLATSTLPLRLEGPGVEGLLAVDLVGDALPDMLVVRPGEPPALARNLGNGQHWLALQLGGYWRVKPELMRTNPHAIGTRIYLEGQGIHTTYDHTTPESGLSQSVAPVVLGLGKNPSVDLVHVRWPDGVIQCELNLAGDTKIDLKENNRKTGSCPVLFTWNGERFVCIGDFLGGGGLGYLVAPGVYGQPDRDESVAIAGDQLRPADGALRISITEPMDEIAYIDHLKLDVVDRPPGVSSTPDERFAPTGPRPIGELLAWREAIEPVRAADLDGRDLTETLRRWDRRTADGFRKLTPWVGYAEEHGIVLDFGGRLALFGPDDRLVLFLAGWVEYPYSQTNYAAASAGVALRPPTIERRRDDGTWEVIEPDAGYPAGLPRRMTRDLTGKLSGPSCVLRIRTNMECYYDQAFIAVRDREAERALRVRTLPVARATLGHRGYTREVSPDGHQPLLYDYDYVDPAPLAWFSGRLTRHGDVVDLLRSDDDRLCVVGPGDEIRIEFDAADLPPPAEGWTRSYVLRSYGYCKDADPFTAISDTVEPLPWRGMPAFPFGRDVRRPADPSYESYLRNYQTRPAGARD